MEQRGIVDYLRSRCDHISKPNIDLDLNPGVSQESQQLYPLALVCLTFADFSYGDAFRFENETVRFYFGSANMLKNQLNAYGRCIPISQQVQILGRSVEMSGPCREEQGAFQNELIGVYGFGKSVEEPFERIPRQEQIEILAGPISQIQQLLVDRCWQVYGLATFHTMAST